MKISHPEQINLNSIKNIIFDWGGVIMNLDLDSTYHAFSELGLADLKAEYSMAAQDAVFENWEQGKIDAQEFREAIQSKLSKPTSFEQIDSAWNAMLKETPEQRIDLLRELRKSHRLFLLSNTNQIHADYYNAYFEKENGFEFASLFEKVYYSHEVGLRKPNAEIFEYVLKDAGLKDEETLFIDDTEVHVNAASKLGIRAFHLKAPLTTEQLFIQWLGLN